MCTVSWIHEEGGYQLFSNRDETYTRKPALPPSAREQRGVRFIAPIDGDQGGSWIGVSAAGYAFGAFYQLEAERRRRILFKLGAALLVSFVLLRTVNVHGDPSRWGLQRNAIFTVGRIVKLLDRRENHDLVWEKVK